MQETRLTEDIGREQWDLVFLSHLVHHFDRASNEALIVRAAAALRPNGVIAIHDVLRSTSPKATSQTGALLDLYFAVTSNSGTWSQDEIAGWISSAGLTPGKAVHLRSAPGTSVVIGIKKGSRRS